MTPPIRDLSRLLASLEPALHPGTYAWCIVPHGTELSAVSAVVTVAEAEGLTVVLPEEQAVAAGWAVRFRAAWITLTVHSDLEAVGLTAAFAEALAREGLSCNVVAGVCHDHLFVPVAQAAQALDALRALQRAAASTAPPSPDRR